MATGSHLGTTADFAPNVQILESIPTGNGQEYLIVLGYVTDTIPTSANHFQTGCILIKIDSKELYQNTGTVASPVWTLFAAGSGITALTGDVLAGPGSGSQVATIAALAVTNAKISATAAIAFSKLAALTSAHILVGSVANVATSVAVTGDVGMSNAGLTTVSGVNGKVVDTIGIENVAATLHATFIPYGAPQALSGAGAVNTTSYQTKLTTTGIGNALTLADGTIGGQLKKVSYVAEGGGTDTAILTPTTALFTTVTFNNIGDYAVLQWLSGIGWQVVETIGAVVV